VPTLPQLNTDGTYVGFVSAIDAGYVNNQQGPTNGGGYSTSDTGSTNDVFVTRFERDLFNKVSFVASTVVSAFGNVFDLTNGMPHESFTYGASAGGTGVSVDPQGRLPLARRRRRHLRRLTAPVTGFFGSGYRQRKIRSLPR